MCQNSLPSCSALGVGVTCRRPGIPSQYSGSCSCPAATADDDGYTEGCQGSAQPSRFNSPTSEWQVCAVGGEGGGRMPSAVRPL